MDNGEREKFTNALRKAKEVLLLSKEYVLGTGKYADYYPIYKDAIDEIDQCNVGGHEHDLDRLRRILSEMDVLFDEERAPDDPECEYRIEIEDCRICFDELGRLIRFKFEPGLP